MSAPKIDNVAPLSEQRAWLEGRLANSSPSDRKTQQDSIEYEVRGVRLASAPLWPQTKDFLKQYIVGCIFFYAKTESAWWSMTVGPDGGYVRINIGPQEVLAINPLDNFHVHALIEDSSFSADERVNIQSTLSASIKPSPYAVANQVWIESNDPAFLTEFLRRRVIVDSARALNMRLMREKRNIYARSYCYNVVTEILGAADNKS
jgi:hypothetical protein